MGNFCCGYCLFLFFFLNILKPNFSAIKPKPDSEIQAQTNVTEL